jgi:hypothetical protein
MTRPGAARRVHFMNPSLATAMLGQQIHRDRLRKPGKK